MAAVLNFFLVLILWGLSVSEVQGIVKIRHGLRSRTSHVQQRQLTATDSAIASKIKSRAKHQLTPTKRRTVTLRDGDTYDEVYVEIPKSIDEKMKMFKVPSGLAKPQNYAFTTPKTENKKLFSIKKRRNAIVGKGLPDAPDTLSPVSPPSLTSGAFWFQILTVEQLENAKEGMENLKDCLNLAFLQKYATIAKAVQKNMDNAKNIFGKLSKKSANIAQKLKIKDGDAKQLIKELKNDVKKAVPGLGVGGFFQAGFEGAFDNRDGALEIAGNIAGGGFGVLGTITGFVSLGDVTELFTGEETGSHGEVANALAGTFVPRLLGAAGGTDFVALAEMSAEAGQVAACLDGIQLFTVGITLCHKYVMAQHARTQKTIDGHLRSSLLELFASHVYNRFAFPVTNVRKAANWYSRMGSLLSKDTRSVGFGLFIEKIYEEGQETSRRDWPTVLLQSGGRDNINRKKRHMAVMMNELPQLSRSIQSDMFKLEPGSSTFGKRAMKVLKNAAYRLNPLKDPPTDDPNDLFARWVVRMYLEIEFWIKTVELQIKRLKDGKPIGMPVAPAPVGLPPDAPKIGAASQRAPVHPRAKPAVADTPVQRRRA